MKILLDRTKKAKKDPLKYGIVILLVVLLLVGIAVGIYFGVVVSMLDLQQGFITGGKFYPLGVNFT